MVYRKLLPTLLHSIDFSIDTKKVRVSLPGDVGMILGAMEDRALTLTVLLSRAGILLFWGDSHHRHIWVWPNSHGTDGCRI